MTSKKDDFAKISCRLSNAMFEHRIAYSARKFVKLSFSDVANVGLPMVRSYNELNLFSRIREIVEQGLKSLFNALSSVCFFS